VADRIEEYKSLLLFQCRNMLNWRRDDKNKIPLCRATIGIWKCEQHDNSQIGSGLMLTVDGFFITNAHVLNFENAKDIKISVDHEIFNGSPKKLKKILYVSKERNLCLAQIELPDDVEKKYLNIPLFASEIQANNQSIKGYLLFDTEFSLQTNSINYFQGKIESYNMVAIEKEMSIDFFRETIDFYKHNKLIKTSASSTFGSSGGPVLELTSDKIIGLSLGTFLHPYFLILQGEARISNKQVDRDIADCFNGHLVIPAPCVIKFISEFLKQT
jgi:hypothetical protein